MKFKEWFEQVEKNGDHMSQRFYDMLEKISVSPSYTENAVEWMEAAYNAGVKSGTEVAERCATLCDEQSKFLLRFSQFGSNAAKDCADRIREVYVK